MMKLKRRAGLTVGALAAVTMLIAPAAFAANITMIGGVSSPAGNAAMNATNVGTLSFVSDSTPSTPMTCSVSGVNGTLKRGGSMSAGMVIGSISALQFGSLVPYVPCPATSLNLPVLVKKNNVPGSTAWPIVVTATPGKGARYASIRIDNVDFKVQSTSKSGFPASYICDLRARGTLTGTFDQLLQKITIAAPSGTYPLNNLEAHDGTGTDTVALTGTTCGGQIWTGDSMRLTGEFSVYTGGGDFTW